MPRTVAASAAELLAADRPRGRQPKGIALPLDCSLNAHTWPLAERFLDDAEPLRASVQITSSGARVVDCGVESPGGLMAGVRLAEICLAGMARISIVAAPSELGRGPALQVATDHPLRACIGAQYAGWQVAPGKYFAMGSGPMRAAAGTEAVLRKYGLVERATCAVGVLETATLPTDEVCRYLATAAQVSPDRLIVFVARTSSVAGTAQVVARSVETALHKLEELGFDLRQVEAGYGLAPMPPCGGDDLTAIGRTNDAILYGGEVMLWVRAADSEIEAIGPRAPSSASRDYGQPFQELFELAGRDFYRLDPLLFSPATVTFVNC